MYFHVYSFKLQIHAHIYRSFIRHHKMLGVRIAKRKNEPQKPANPCGTKLCARIFFVNTLQSEYLSGYSVFYFPNCSVIVVRKRAVFAYFRFYVDSWGREKTHLVRITHPRRDGTGEVSFITGWMVEPGGKLRMTTPYGGKSYARNG